MDDRYLHMAKRLHLGNYELSTVEQISTRFYLIGTTNGTIEAIKISLNEDITTSSQLFFFSNKRITSIRFLHSIINDETYFAARTEQDHLFVSKLSSSKFSMLLNIDKNTKDVGSI